MNAGYVLVLDDDELLRELLEVALGGEDYEVHSAATISAALDLAKQRQPRVILFDLTLGAEKGDDFVSAYRQLPQATARLIVCSGSPDLERRGAALGIDDHLRKPWDLDDLLGLVARAFTGEPPR